MPHLTVPHLTLSHLTLSRLIFALLPPLVLAWTVWGAAEYRKLKRALREGRRGALLREYRLTVAGELVSGALALLAVGPGLWRAAPALPVALPPAAQGVAWGLCGGVAVSLLLGPLLARRGVGPAAAGDFAALLPRLPAERRLFVLAALSAGVCEELLFRGYGLRLFAQMGLTGLALLGAAALAFGLAHAYQGALGVIVTALLGLALGVAYVATGSLLVPMLLHAAIDLRALTLPPPRAAPAPSGPL